MRRKNNKINHLEVAYKILRSCIKSDMKSTKRFLLKSKGPYCSLKKCKLEPSNLVVDHEPPYNFNLIVNSWIRDREINLKNNFFVVNKWGEIDFSNQNLKKDFKRYHRKLSEGYLRLVEKKLNNTMNSQYKMRLPKNSNVIKQLQLFKI